MSLRLYIPADHPAFAGHFPGRPIVPGVVLLDAAIHAIAVDLGCDVGACQIKTAKFLSPVGPNTELSLSHSGLSATGVRFEIATGTRKVASGQLDFGRVASP